MKSMLLALLIIFSAQSIHAADLVSFTSDGIKTSAGFFTWQNLSEQSTQIEILKKQVKTLQVCAAVAAVVLVYVTLFKKSRTIERNCADLCIESSEQA